MGGGRGHAMGGQEMAGLEMEEDALHLPGPRSYEKTRNNFV